MSKILVIPDVQIKPDINLAFIYEIGQYIVDKKPDVVVCLGDFFDFPSLSSYDKGKLSFEGRRLQDDIATGQAAMEMMLRPLRQLQARQQQNKKKVYRPRLVFTLGNHECLAGDAEVLTSKGFVNIKEVTTGHVVASYTSGGEVKWDNPVSVFSKHYAGIMHKYESQSFYSECTEKHRMYTVSSADNLIVRESKDVPNNFKIIAALNSTKDYGISDADIRLAAWLCTDSHHGQYGSKTLYQRESNAHKVRKVLKDAGVEWKEKIRDRDIKEICGKTLLKKPEPSVEFYLNVDTIPMKIDNNTTLPPWVTHLSNSQWDMFLQELVEADGTVPKSAKECCVFYGKKQICDDVQAAAVVHGWSASLTEYRPNEWRVNLTKRTTRKQEGLQKQAYDYAGNVYCLEMPDGNFVVRHGNKCHVTGNCRLQTLAANTPELSGFVGYHLLDLEKHGWEVYDFLKPVEIDGIYFCHYMQNHFTGKPLAGSALNQLKTVGRSFVVGHKQILDVAMLPTIDGDMRIGIVAGAAYPHVESYKGHQGNHHWRGIFLLHNCKNGYGDPCFVSLDYLKNRYRK